MKRNKPSHVSLSGLVALGSFAALAGCGQPDADTPPSSGPRAPRPAGTTSLNLTTDEGETTYAGSLVLWDDAIEAPRLAALLDATRQYNETAVKAEKAFDSYLSSKIEPARRGVDAKKAEFDAARNREKDVIDAKQVELAAGWARALIDAAVAKGEGLDAAAKETLRGQAIGSFRKYCEAQIWQFAIEKVLATGVFARRPSPNALCETFYAEAGLLGGESCAAAPDGKNYYACVWNEGVRKTTFFARLPVATQQVVESTFASDTGRRYFAGEAEFQDSPTSPIPAGCASSNFRNVFLGMNGKVTCPAIGAGAPISFGMVQRDAAGVEKPVFPIMRDKNLDTSTPARLLGTWEGQSDRVEDCDIKDMQDICPWKPQVVSGGAPTAVPAGVRDTYLAAAPKLRAFSNPISGCDAELRSPNNAFFNANRLKQVNFFSACTKPDDLSLYPEVIVKSLPEVAALDDEYEALRTALDSDKGNFCKPSDDAICKANPEANWGCLLGKYTDEKYNAVKAPRVAQVVYRDFRLTARRNPDGTTALLFDLGITGQGAIAGACVQAKGAAPVKACGLDAELTGYGMKADFEPATGRLLVTLPIRAKRFAPESAGELMLGDIRGIRRFEGATLRMETYPAALSGTRQYLSGKVVVVRGNAEMAQGTASYLLDKRFDDRVSSFCNATN